MESKRLKFEGTKNCQKLKKQWRLHRYKYGNQPISLTQKKDINFLKELVHCENNSLNYKQLSDAIQIINQLLTEKPTKIEINQIKEVILPLIAKCLKNTNKIQLRMKTLETLTHLSAVEYDEATDSIAAVFIPYFWQLLDNLENSLCEHALPILGTIFESMSKLSNDFVTYGIVQSILDLIKVEQPISFIDNIIKTIRKLCRCTEVILIEDQVKNIFEAVKKVLTDYTDENILINTVWTISHLTSNGNEHVQIAIQCDIITMLIPLLSHKVNNIQMGVISTFSNIVINKDDLAQYMVNQGVLPQLRALLKHNDKILQKQTIWVISNIMSYNEELIQAVIDEGILSEIINILKDSCIQNQEEAAWNVYNLTSIGNQEQILKFIDQDGLSPFCNLFSSSDEEIIKVVLETISNILTKIEDFGPKAASAIKKCNGLLEDKIKYLQSCNINSIQNLAKMITEN